MNKRGVSEIIASLIIITIAIGLGSGLYIYSLKFFADFRSSMGTKLSLATAKADERFIITYSYYNSTDSTLHVFIYSYGDIEARIVAIYVNGQHFEKETIVNPDEIKELTVSISLSSGTYKVKVVSERGNSYEKYVEV
ncbi:hypothetical protein DRN86_01605 [Candidatus Geothermarchaeota archaeon]|nr:MAG: hypothetical protein DRN86_01605 [Candidatus Geothermarchaeota archaeon]